MEEADIAFVIWGFYDLAQLSKVSLLLTED